MVGVPGQGRRFDTHAALDAAMAVFWRHGYEGTSISDLTRAMGITASSLYAAFDGKRQLFDRVVERYVDTKGRFVARAFVEESDCPSLIRRLLTEAASEYADRTGPGGCLIISAGTCVTAANREVEDTLKALRQANIARLETAIRADIEAGRVTSAVDAGAIAHFVGAVMQGMAQRGRDGATVSELQSTAQMALHQVEQAVQAV